MRFTCPVFQCDWFYTTDDQGLGKVMEFRHWIAYHEREKEDEDDS